MTHPPCRPRHHPQHHPLHHPLRQPRGFLLPAAIFVLVVLSLLGAFAVNISSSQHLASALDVQGAQAQQAARSGMEWAIYQIGPDPNYSGARYCTPAGVSESFTMPAAASSLARFTVTMSCERSLNKDGIKVYRLRATACNQPQAAEPRCPNPGSSSNYVERQLEAAVELACSDSGTPPPVCP